MRRALFVACLVSLGCAERALAPNTDVGLLVWADVHPSALSARNASAAFTVRINVYNPSDQEIQVLGGPPYTSTSDPEQTKGLWGSMRIARGGNRLNAGPNWDSFGDSVYVVPARSTIADEHDTSLRSWRLGGWSLSPGVYRVRVWFNGHEGAGANLTITP